eukprot:gene28683-32397_t
MLGDQFTMLALPWLVLTMTKDPLALGLVIAIMSVPRAVFMLIGGAIVQYVDWLAARMQPGQTVAVDGAVLGLAVARLLEQALSANKVTLRTDRDLLSDIWRDRPSLPTAEVYELPPPYASASRAEKLAALRAAMASHGASRHLMSTLDDIAWLFNLRGADVNYNPVFLAHALIDPVRATLFVADGKVPAALRAALAAFCGVEGWRIVLAGSASEFIFRSTAWATQQGARSVCKRALSVACGWTC